MGKETLIAFIQSNIPHFFVTNEALHVIADQFQEVEIARNDFFLKAGNVSNYMFLASGFMRAYTLDTNGDEVTTYFYPPNRMVFEVSSFFQHTISTENIQAVTDCKGYFITFEQLNRLFHNVPEFREFGRLMLVKEFVAYKQRTLAMINKSAEERYSELMTNNSEVFLHASLKHIASFLGITDTSLSRIRREYAKKGV